MALGKARKSIAVKGGGTFYIRELDPTPTNTYSDIGFLAQDVFVDEWTMVESVDETGGVVNQIAGAQKVTWEATLEQSAIDELNLVTLLANKDKYWEGYYAVTLPNGRVHEFSFPLLKISFGTTLTFASATKRQVKIMFNALIPKAAYTRGVTAFNVVAGVPYILVDGGSATFNLSNTEASALATAII